MQESINIAEIIHTALASRRMIVLPGMGAFVRNHDGKIIFSQLIDADDGVLRHMVAEQTEDEMKGDALVDRFVFELRGNLEDTGVCRIGSFGTMTVTPNGTVIFQEGEPESPTERDVPHHNEEEDRHHETTGNVDTKATRPRQKKLYYHTSKRHMDKLLVFAIVVIILSIAAIAYGMYVSKNTSQDVMTAPEMTTDPTDSSEENIN